MSVVISSVRYISKEIGVFDNLQLNRKILKFTIMIIIMIIIIINNNNNNNNVHDLKLFAKYDQQLQGLLNIVKSFSYNIQMEFGQDKCAKATFFREKLLKEYYSRYRNGH